MADLRFRIQFKRVASGTAAAERTVQTFQQTLAAKVKQTGMALTYQGLIDNSEMIETEIRADLDKFGRQVATFFTSIQSPNIPAQKSRGVSFAPRQGRVGVSFRPQGPKPFSAGSNRQFMQRKPTAGEVRMIWTGLASSTIKRKGNSSFFVDSGQLRSALAAGLGEAFASIVKPRIDIDPLQDGSGQPRIRVRAVLNPAFRKDMFDNLGGATDYDVQERAKADRLIVRYLQVTNKILTVQKLGNIGRQLLGTTKIGTVSVEGKGASTKRAYRPFLQPSIAFWVLNRLPTVLTNSIYKVMGKAARRELRAKSLFRG